MFYVFPVLLRSHALMRTRAGPTQAWAKTIPRWGGIARPDYAAIELVKGLVTLDPAQRYTATAALRHRYFNRGIGWLEDIYSEQALRRSEAHWHQTIWELKHSGG